MYRRFASLSMTAPPNAAIANHSSTIANRMQLRSPCDSRAETKKPALKGRLQNNRTGDYLISSRMRMAAS